MLLIIENKDDPAGQIAEEAQGPADFAYIPIIQVSFQSDIRKEKLKYFVDRLCYEHRSSQCLESCQYTQALLPLFLKAVGHTGQRPQYLTAAAEPVCGIPPMNRSSGFCACG